MKGACYASVAFRSIGADEKIGICRATKKGEFGAGRKFRRAERRQSPTENFVVPGGTTIEIRAFGHFERGRWARNQSVAVNDTVL